MVLNILGRAILKSWKKFVQEVKSLERYNMKKKSKQKPTTGNSKTTYPVPMNTRIIQLVEHKCGITGLKLGN